MRKFKAHLLARCTAFDKIQLMIQNDLLERRNISRRYGALWFDIDVPTQTKKPPMLPPVRICVIHTECYRPTLIRFVIKIVSYEQPLRSQHWSYLLPNQIVKVQIFMTDILERSSINPIRIEYFGDHKPASTLVEVSALVDPRMRVEIEAVAYIDDKWIWRSFRN